MTLVDLLSAKFSSSHFCFCSKSVSHLRTSNTVQVSVGLSTGVGVASLHPFRFLGDRAIGPLSVLSCLTLVYCGQTVGRIKMKLGRKVGLGPGHIVLDGNPRPPPPKGHSPHPNFRPMSVVAKRLDGSIWHLAWRWASIQATLC